MTIDHTKRLLWITVVFLALSPFGVMVQYAGMTFCIALSVGEDIAKGFENEQLAR